VATTLTINLYVYPAACGVAVAYTAPTNALTMWYKVGDAAKSAVMDAWENTPGCPTWSWSSTMTAAADGDKCKDDITFDDATRKISIKQITNDSNGLLKVGDYTRTISGTIAPGKTMTTPKTATITIKVTDPACDTATITFVPSGGALAASTYLLGAASPTEITLPTSATVSKGTCSVTITDTNDMAASQLVPDLSVTGKIKYTVVNNNSNIGRWTFTRKRTA
jgi:hypothetical protein